MLGIPIIFNAKAPAPEKKAQRISAPSITWRSYASFIVEMSTNVHEDDDYI